MRINSPISDEQSAKMTPSGVAPSSEVKPVSVEHAGKLALSVQRDPRPYLNSKLEPEISGEGTWSEESSDVHMEEHSEGGADWEGESKPDPTPMRAFAPAPQPSLQTQQYSYSAPIRGVTHQTGQRPVWQQNAQQSYPPLHVDQEVMYPHEYGQQAMRAQQAQSSPLMHQGSHPAQIAQPTQGGPLMEQQAGQTAKYTVEAQQSQETHQWTQQGQCDSEAQLSHVSRIWQRPASACPLGAPQQALQEGSPQAAGSTNPGGKGTASTSWPGQWQTAQRAQQSQSPSGGEPGSISGRSPPSNIVVLNMSTLPYRVGQSNQDFRAPYEVVSSMEI